MIRPRRRASGSCCCNGSAGPAGSRSIAGQRAKLERELRELLGDRLVDTWKLASSVVLVARYVARHPIDVARLLWARRGP